MAKIGVLLSGCGVKDGTEIHEAVITLLTLDQKGAEIVCMAPDMDQHEVVNHYTGKVADEKRNVLVESARIARGNIKDIRDINVSDIDGLIIPGGLGAAKNLSDFAEKGADAVVNDDVQKFLTAVSVAGKPIGAICIAPATLTRALGDKHLEVTIGNDAGTADAIQAMGGKHKTCTVDMIHVDTKNSVVTTPAYMLGPGIKDVAEGIKKLVEKVLEMA